MNNFFMSPGNGILAGSAVDYASLPTTIASPPLTIYANTLWFVQEGSDGPLSWVPFTDIYKYPVGLYTPDPTLNFWVLTPFNVKLAEDSMTLVNITDWTSFVSYAFDIGIGDRLIYNNITYVNLTGTIGTAPNVDTTNWGCYIDFESRPLTPWKAGRIHYDGDQKTHQAATGYTDVSIDVGRENQIQVFNNTATPILNGDPVSLVGTFTGILPDVIPSDSSFVFSVLTFTGVATMDIPAGEEGVVTSFGLVKGVNTQSLLQTFMYLDSNGWYTQTRPRYPERRLIVGGVVKTGVTDGVLSIGARELVRADLGKSYGFTSTGIGAGLYYKAGFYEWATTSIALTQASLTQTYGTVGRAYAAHAGIVPSGPGIVDTGQVGLRVTGIEDSETGVQLAGQVGIITEDITTLTANVMAETSEKFSGQVTYELYVVSGSPVNYSLTFNYGYSKYDDLGNKDFTLTGLECIWQGNALDIDFDIALKHHTNIGWTYAATGFLAGNGDIARKSVDQVLAGDVVNNLNGAWKRINLDIFINGAGSEGIIFEIVPTANNTIQTMDLHVSAVSEEL